MPLTLVPPASSRRSISWDVVPYELSPVLLLYFLAATLAVLPNTRLARVAVVPPSLFLAWRTATGVYFDDPIMNHFNYGLIMVLMILGMRVIDWALRAEPFRRKGNDAGPLSSTQVLKDSFDLATNLRGIGWDWGANCSCQPAMIITPSFLLDACIKSAFYLLSFDLCLALAKALVVPLGTTFTIFDQFLPPPSRYAKAVFIALLMGTCIFTGMNFVYQLTSIVGAVLFGQTREDWPALFVSPHAATSLADFWGKRWHQLFRRVFLVIGGKPLSYALGRPGGIVGVFLVSGILHDWGMWGMGQGVEYSSVTGYFLIQSLGLILEATLESIIGRVFFGPAARVWTFFWVVGAAVWMVDAWIRRGLGHCTFLPPELQLTHRIEQALRFGY